MQRLLTTRDPAGRVVTQEWCACGSLNRLIDANGHATSWDRDVQGRVTASGNATTAVYEIGQSVASKTFTFDANGNLTSDGTRTFEWDAKNQLVAVVAGATRTEYSYDGFHRKRSSRVLDGTTTTVTNYIWDRDEIVEERDGATGVVTRSFVGSGETDGSVAQFYAFDHLGSIRSATNSAGEKIAQQDYDPYGRASVTGSAVPARSFQGAFASDGDLLSTRYRQYDSGLGRWLSSDPIAWMGGSNFCSFVVNDPLGRTDFDGLASCSLVSKRKLFSIPIPPYNQKEETEAWQLVSAYYMADDGRKLHAGIDRVVLVASTDTTNAGVEKRIPRHPCLHRRMRDLERLPV